MSWPLGAGRSVPGTLSAKQFTYARDLNDEPSVNLTLAAGAQYLVTFDNDLLDLMNQATPEGNDFRQRFPGLLILTPAAFFQALSPKEEEPPAPGEVPNPATSAASGTGPLTPPEAVSPRRTATASAAVIARPSLAP